MRSRSPRSSCNGSGLRRGGIASSPSRSRSVIDRSPPEAARTSRNTRTIAGYTRRSQTGRLSHSSACTRRCSTLPLVQHLLEAIGHDVAELRSWLDDRGRRAHVLHLDDRAPAPALRRAGRPRRMRKQCACCMRGDQKRPAEPDEHLKRAGNVVDLVAEVDAEVADADAPADALQPRRVWRRRRPSGLARPTSKKPNSFKPLRQPSAYSRLSSAIESPTSCLKS